MVKYAGLD